VLPDRRPPLKKAEEAVIDAALTRAADNQRVAAGIIRLSRQALNKRLGGRTLPTEPKA
jgi:two-component system nitrogen regulation response regulator GlnG